MIEVIYTDTGEPVEAGTPVIWDMEPVRLTPVDLPE